MITINNAWKHGNIGIDQLAGYLRSNGYNVDIKYTRTHDDIYDIFKGIKEDYLFYGFSVTSQNVSMCYSLARMLKKYRKNITIDLGGGFVTRYYKEVFGETTDVDYITLGDGEIPTEYLLNQLIEDQHFSTSPQTGHFAVASPNDIVKKNPYLNTEVSHFPAFDYYENDTAVRNSRKVHCIQTKNNVCTGNCTFCTERHGKICYKKISNIIDQIIYVHTHYGVKKIFFTDDNIFDPNDDIGKENVRELCWELLRLKNECGYKLVFQCYIKAISLKDIPEDHNLLELMRQAGFVEVFVGIESGDNDDLLLYNKHTTVDDNYTIIKMIKQHGLFPIMGFIGFNPYSTDKKIENNFKFLYDVECTYLPNYFYCFVNVNKYTAIYDMAKKDSLVISDDTVYTDVQYLYKDTQVKPILEYVRNVMLKELKGIQYETDWIIYSYMEHRLLYNINDLSAELKNIKDADFQVIKKYLSTLFIDHDLERFKIVADDFWNHFLSQQNRIKAIYRYLVSQHTVSSILPLYQNKLTTTNRILECRKCVDIITGYYQKGSCYNQFWFDAKTRLSHLNNIEITRTSEYKTIVIILESPHIAEYNVTPPLPAMGTTGDNLQKVFPTLLAGIIDNNDKYRIILMNSIQYQCSMGQCTKKYRDHLWLNLWFNENLKDDFTGRLKKYKPDLIFNFCTTGNHQLESLLLSRTKTVINKRYIDFCIAPLKSPYSLKTTLLEIVSDSIFSSISATVFTGNHPSSWKIKNGASMNDIKKAIHFKDYPSTSTVTPDLNSTVNLSS